MRYSVVQNPAGLTGYWTPTDVGTELSFTQIRRKKTRVSLSLLLFSLPFPF